MSSEATRRFSDPNAISGPAHGSVSSAGRRPGAPAAAPRRPSRLRRGVFSLLAGVRLAAGGGALILMGWSGAEMLRSPLSAPMIEGWWGSAGHFLPLVALMLFPVLQMQHFWKVILGVSWVISGRRYDDGPPPWGIMGVKETSP